MLEENGVFIHGLYRCRGSVPLVTSCRINQKLLILLLFPMKMSKITTLMYITVATRRGKKIIYDGDCNSFPLSRHQHEKHLKILSQTTLAMAPSTCVQQSQLLQFSTTPEEFKISTAVKGMWKKLPLLSDLIQSHQPQVVDPEAKWLSVDKENSHIWLQRERCYNPFWTPFLRLPASAFSLWLVM